MVKCQQTVLNCPSEVNLTLFKDAFFWCHFLNKQTQKRLWLVMLPIDNVSLIETAHKLTDYHDVSDKRKQIFYSSSLRT